MPPHPRRPSALHLQRGAARCCQCKSEEKSTRIQKPPKYWDPPCLAEESKPSPAQKSMPNMTGRPGYRTMEMVGGSSVSYLARTPCVPFFSTLFNRGGNRRAFRLPGKGGDHFHCTVEPSPGHIRCRKKSKKSLRESLRGGLCQRKFL